MARTRKKVSGNNSRAVSRLSSPPLKRARRSKKPDTPDEELGTDPSSSTKPSHHHRPGSKGNPFVVRPLTQEVDASELSTTTTIKPSVQESTASAEIFPFASLPLEIQFLIFQHTLFRTGTPRSPLRKAQVQSTLSLLLLNKSYYALFAPVRYQSLSISFFDPITFANTFLSRCTDICLANLRSLECRYEGVEVGFGKRRNPDSYNPTMREHARHLTEVLSTYTELKNLSKLKITHPIYVTPDELINLIFPRNTLSEDAAARWIYLDNLHGNILGRIEATMLKRTFRGFETSHEFSFDAKPGSWWKVQERSLTFSRRSHD